MGNGKLSAISSILLRKLELYGITGVPINCNWFDPFTAKFSQKQILTKFPNFILWNFEKQVAQYGQRAFI